MFRVLPASVRHTFTTRSITTSTQPATESAQDKDYVSPLQTVIVDVGFASELQLRECKYILSEDAYDNEWTFAEDSLRELHEKISEALAAYNKAVINHAKDLGLSHSEILGQVHKDSVAATHHNVNLDYQDDRSTRAPTIQTVSTNRSTRTVVPNKRVLSYLAGMNKRRS